MLLIIVIEEIILTNYLIKFVLILSRRWQLTVLLHSDWKKKIVPKFWRTRNDGIAQRASSSADVGPQQGLPALVPVFCLSQGLPQLHSVEGATT
jgi:hypothetical protein